MNAPHRDTPPHGAPVSALRIVLGTLATALWGGAWFVWGALSLMGTLMANDAGRASHGTHAALILGMLGGQIVAGAAGIPLGLSLWWGNRRRALLWIFAGLLLAGLLAQAAALAVFFAAVGA